MFYILVALIFSSVPKDAGKITVDFNEKPYFVASFEENGNLKAEMNAGSVQIAKLADNDVIVDGKKTDVLSRLDLKSVQTISELKEVDVIDRGEYQWKITRGKRDLVFKAFKNGKLDQLYTMRW